MVVKKEIVAQAFSFVPKRYDIRHSRYRSFQSDLLKIAIAILRRGGKSVFSPGKGVVQNSFMRTCERKGKFCPVPLIPGY